jgi:hypothetical protein
VNKKLGELYYITTKVILKVLWRNNDGDEFMKTKGNVNSTNGDSWTGNVKSFMKKYESSG